MKYEIEISDPSYEPEDGTPFDAIVAALEHFEIPAFIREIEGDNEADKHSAMRNERFAKAEGSFQGYNFGDDVVVEASGLWEYDTTLAEFTKPVFVTIDGKGDSIKLTFRVRFNEDGSIAEACAIDPRSGSMFGGDD